MNPSFPLLAGQKILRIDDKLARRGQRTMGELATRKKGGRVWGEQRGREMSASVAGGLDESRAFPP